MKLEQSEHVSELLSNMLKRKYPKYNADDSLNIDDILGWELWHGFMKIYGMYLCSELISLKLAT